LTTSSLYTNHTPIVTEHTYADLPDWQRILDLLCQVRLEQPHCNHLGDLLWNDRVPAPDPAQNIHLWEDEEGRLVAFSMLHTHWQTLSYEILPRIRTQHLEQQIIAWSEERLIACARMQTSDWAVSINAPENDTQRVDLLRSAGFVVDDAYAWHLIRPLRDPIPAPVLPAGFTVRHLAGEHEAAAWVEAHRDAWQQYGSTMTVELHLRLMQMPAFRPELNLVVVVPDGTFASAMIGWLDPLNKSAEIEPLGTRPAFAV